MTSKLRVAIAAKVFIDWSGGVDFIIYLSNALAKNQNFDVYFFVPDSKDPLDIIFNNRKDLQDSIDSPFRRLTDRLKPLPKSNIVEYETAFHDLDPRIKLVIYKNTKAGFLNALRRKRADVVIPTTSSFGPYFPLPWVGYIWDFQHKHFPKYFAKDELKGRDIIFKNTMHDAPAVIVNSLATAEDIRKLVPGQKKTTKLFALPFSPYPVKSWLQANPKKAKKKYSIPDDYFIVCNQFWLHKSHMTVIEAMAKLARNGISTHLVCTGKMEEPRMPEYISEIKDAIKKLGLTDKVHLLGLIPKQDQIALVKGARALVQPTLYEGGPGGGSAYNAVALGVPVIASDIPVNTEMAAENVIFFKVKSSVDLAKKMQQVLAKPKSQTANNQLLKVGEERAAKLSQVLADAVHSAINNFNNGLSE